MRWHAEPLAHNTAPLVVAVFLALFLLGPIGVILAHAGGALSALSSADVAVLRFTLTQAAVSSIVSVALAVPVARALARRRFPGRGALIVVMGAPFILPTLVAVVGLLAVFGRNGLFNDALAALGLSRISPYGFHGVVLAHVFLNLPLATRLILQGHERVPGDHHRLAAALGFGGWARFRHLEMPMLAQVVPGALAGIFLICLTSFAVALTLGGGPAATTVELAIYQAFLYEFDLARMAQLALVQMGVGVVALVLIGRWAAPLTSAPARQTARVSAPGGMARVLDSGAIALAALFLLAPLALVVARGLPHVAGLPMGVWLALGSSLWIAGWSLAVLIPLAAVVTLTALRARWVEGVGMAALSVSPLVIGTGLFLALHPQVDPAAYRVPIVATVNAAMALPFVLRALVPAALRAQADYGRLSKALGLSPLAHARLILWPLMRRPAGFALGLAAALSLGDLGVVVLFAQTEGATLPLALQRLMGAYRSDDAAGAALLLLGVALAGFWLFDRVIGGARDADV